jgi:hypothetical protein
MCLRPRLAMNKHLMIPIETVVEHMQATRREAYIIPTVLHWTNTRHHQSKRCSQREMFDDCHVEPVAHSCNSCYKVGTHTLHVVQHNFLPYIDSCLIGTARLSTLHRVDVAEFMLYILKLWSRVVGSQRPRLRRSLHPKQLICVTTLTAKQTRRIAQLPIALPYCIAW